MRIYKIESKSSSKVYVGSTTTSLEKRMSRHRTNFRRYSRGQPAPYTSSFELLVGDCRIILLDEGPFRDRRELHEKEREYIESLDSVNILHPTRSPEEYREDNRDRIKEQKREWYHRNKPIRKTEHFDCDCGGRYTTQNKRVHQRTARHKIWDAHQKEAIAHFICQRDSEEEPQEGPTQED